MIQEGVPTVVQPGNLHMPEGAALKKKDQKKKIQEDFLLWHSGNEPN